MVRLRRVPVFVSTLALVAGCGSADRAEVTGIVRDGRTGAPVAGARVTGADGVATHTDADGRFTIAVTRGLRTQLRVSAEGHVDAVQSLGEPQALGGLDFTLDPVVITDLGEAGGEPPDPDAVVRWATADWIAERFSRGHAERRLDERGEEDGGWRWIEHASEPPRRSCPMLEPGAIEASEPPDVPIEVDAREAPWLGSGATCVRCHRDDEAGNQANVVLGGSHAGLGDSCLSCHATDGAFERRSCDRCHGVGIENDTEEHSWYIELDQFAIGHPRYDDAIARARDAMARRLEERRAIEDWIAALVRDGSRGAHDPRLVRRLYEASAR